ncbi:hypothetical protein F5B22DRAFT_630067 [Xylaria bambusicola]|uniref:uncharacterized protein n=1 Tax=Xylaria bambusicola TaxID=326684 RepID=UPI002008932D|nr:uncharacterized protein F5B22DRAFT_630067 [Xylaria bambusicola]KAI0503199.1 hypothetical protein F5B22DRAFT_630067 [Xylaria bambusicola]
MSMIPGDGDPYSSNGLSNYVTTALMTELEHVSGNDIPFQPSFGMPISPGLVGGSSGLTYDFETGGMGQRVSSFSCPPCSRHFGSAKDLARHVATHSTAGNELVYSCRCGKSAVRKDNFLRHIRGCSRPSRPNGKFECRCGYGALSSADDIEQHVKGCGYARAGRPKKRRDNPAIGSSTAANKV